MSRIGIGIVGLVVFGLGPALAEDKTGVSYRCEDGKGVTASFLTASHEVLITTGGQSFRLPQGMSGSGARYTDGSVVFWIKGDDAQLEAQGRTTSCHAQ